MDNFIDHQALDSLYGDNLAFKAKMFNMFLERVDSYIELLVSQVRNERIDELRQTVHKFRSSLDFICVPMVAEIASKVEQMINDNAPKSEIIKLATELINQTVLIKEELTNELTKFN